MGQAPRHRLFRLRRQLPRRLLPPLLSGANPTAGSGSTDTGQVINVGFAPTIINAYTAPQAPYVTSITVSVSPLPSGTVYPLVLATGPGWAPDPIVVSQTGQSGVFAANLVADTSLTVGSTYSGTLKLALCKDPACKYQYTIQGGTLAYNLIVVPSQAFTVSLAAKLSAGNYAMTPGVPVTVTANGPVIWSSFQSSGYAQLVTISSTSTTWTGTIPVNHSTGAIAVSMATSTQIQSTGSVQFEIP